MPANKKTPIMMAHKQGTQEEKMKALQNALKQIEKDFGQGAVMKLGQNFVANINSIPTGSIGLDMALGVGGVPKGRIVELYGHESSGKTTVSLQIVAQCQKQNGIAAFIDVEHALDPGYASSLGVNIDELLVSQPDTGDQAMEIAEQLIRSGAVDLVVVDSVAAMLPREEASGDMGQSHVGLQARMMSQAMRKLTAVVSKFDCCVIFINQLREMVGAQAFQGKVPTTTPGGRALKFFSSVRVEVTKVTTLKNGDESIGTRVRCNVVKNKVAPPFKIIEFDMMFGKGSSVSGEILDLGTTLGIIKQGGAWFSYGEERLGMGRENARKYLDENPELAEKLVEEIKKSQNKFLFIYRKDGKPMLKEEKPEKDKKITKKSKESKLSTTETEVDLNAIPDEEDFN